MKNAFSLLLLSFVFSLQAQTTKGVSVASSQEQQTQGNTYALIIGISEYENFPSLQYADKDAMAFYSFLRSDAVAVPDSNIRLILNEKAKSGDIWSGFSWLLRRAVNKGDRVFIYFSGHGDAANEAEAYLLAYDAPNANDPNLYNAGGTFQVYNLKMKIRELASKGMKVILVTDACRTNELPGKSEGARWTFESIMEKQAGEIQMTSCASNEQSMEGKDWGGGRGIFSYHLVNGLSGLADKDPEDGDVTLYELERYVKDNVRKDTRSPSTNKPRQNPVFCCSEMDNDLLAKVDARKKQELLAQKNKEEDNTLIAQSTKRGKISDAAVNSLYEKFAEAIDSNNLIEPDTASAYHYYKLICEKTSNEDLKADVKDALIAALNNDAQKDINAFIMNNNEGLMKRRKALPELNLIEELLPADNFLVKENFPKKVYVNSLMQAVNFSVSAMETNMALIDSALKIKPGAAYLLFEKAHIFMKFGRMKEALPEIRAAVRNAPNWQVANVGYASVLAALKMDSAFYYALKGYNIDTTNANALMGLGNVSFMEKDYSTSIVYWRKLIVKVPRGFVGYYMIGACYKELNQLDSAFLYLSKAYSVNSQATVLVDLAEVEKRRNNFSHAKELIRTSIEKDSLDPAAYYLLVQLLAETGNTAESLKYLEQGCRLAQHSQKDVSATYNRNAIMEDKSFLSLKDDRRFLDLLDRYFTQPLKEKK